MTLNESFSKFRNNLKVSYNELVEISEGYTLNLFNNNASSWKTYPSMQQINYINLIIFVFKKNFNVHELDNVSINDVLNLNSDNIEAEDGIDSNNDVDDENEDIINNVMNKVFDLKTKYSKMNKYINNFSNDGEVYEEDEEEKVEGAGARDNNNDEDINFDGTGWGADVINGLNDWARARHPEGIIPGYMDVFDWERKYLETMKFEEMGLGSKGSKSFITRKNTYNGSFKRRGIFSNHVDGIRKFLDNIAIVCSKLNVLAYDFFAYYMIYLSLINKKKKRHV